MPFRIGFGYDVHALAAGGTLRLGGVSIPHTHQAVGHSDADVLVHALCDALLGALAMGDIGTHFPDSDPSYRGINSLELLTHIMKLVGEAGYSVENLDTTVCLQEPKIKPHIPLMRETLAKTMELEVSRVSVKATTEEKLGFTGREEGVAAYAVVLLRG